MAIQFINPIVAGTVLVRSQIQSQNYVPGVSGWAIFQNGNAEFTQLTIISNDGGGNTVVIQNGHIQIFKAGVLVAEGTPNNGSGIAGWLSYATKLGINYFSALTAGDLSLGKVGISQVAGVNFNQIAAGLYELFIATGGDAGTLPSQISMLSETSPGAGNAKISMLAHVIQMLGDFTADTIRSGRASTPAPGAGGGTTTVAVAFGQTFPATPRVTIDPVTTVDPNPTGGVTITGYVDSVTTSGFTIRAFRSTNSSTNWDWQAIRDHP